MKNRFLLTLTFLIAGISFAQAQNFEAPTEGKAVVYFLRPSSLGAAINFRYFDSDQFIGRFNGSKYMRYECEPGEHLFWANAENRDWITANLEAGKIYLIEAKVQMGGFKARVHLVPLETGNEKKMKKVNKLISKKPPVTITQQDISKMNKKLADYIQGSLEKYETKFKNEQEIIHISADMNFSK